MKGKAKDGKDSYAVQLAKPTHWPEFRMVACIVSEAKKVTSSRAGMVQTVATSPYYDGWLKSIDTDLENMRKGIRNKNFTLVGSTAEANALKMHATMMTTIPSIIYWAPATIEIMHAVMHWREGGLESYFTMDAGPQVKILCLSKDIEKITKNLSALGCVKKIIVCKPGDGAQLVKEHLF